MKKYYKVKFNPGDGRSFIVTNKRPSYKTWLKADVLVEYSKGGIRLSKVKTPLIIFSSRENLIPISEDELMLEIL